MVNGRLIALFIVILGVIGLAWWSYSLSLRPQFDIVEIPSPCSRITFNVVNPGNQISGVMQATASASPVSEDFLFLPAEPIEIESLGPSGTSRTKLIEFRTDGVPRGTYQITLTLFRFGDAGNTMIGTSTSHACTVE